MKQFLEFLVRGIVNNPDSVEINESEEYGQFIYRIKVDESDMGVVIGKQGKNINAIRNMAKAKAIKDDIRIRIYIDEENENNEIPQIDTEEVFEEE